MKIITGIFFATGLFFLAAEILRLPTMRARGAFLVLSKRKRKKFSPRDALAEKIAPHIRAGEDTRADIADMLEADGGEVTPETFIARAVADAILTAVLLSPLLLLSKAAALGIIALSFAVYARSINTVKKRVSKKRQKIEEELPVFVGYCANRFKKSKDIIGILSAYSKTAGEEFGKELEMTVADMGSNADKALRRLARRVNSPKLDEVTERLRDVADGHYNELTWELCRRSFSEARKEDLLRKANKIPGKMKVNLFLLLIAMMLLYGAVLAQVLLSSAGALFG